MTTNIPIRNIYYMLCYAFGILKQSAFRDIAAEEFDNIHDLLAAILSRGTARLIKQGLHRDYVDRLETLPVVRGRIDMPGTIGQKLACRPRVVCSFELLSEDNLLNRILKTTLLLLRRHPGVDAERRNVLDRVLSFLTCVGHVLPDRICWNTIRFGRQTRAYRTLLGLCRFVLEGLLLTEEKGSYRLASFLDNQQLHQLFERFVREYFVQHHPDLNPRAARIPWQLDEEPLQPELLPGMHSDITLTCGNRVLIIDTKFYERIMMTRFGAETLRSLHLYQIFAYVKNLASSFGDSPHSVSGLLLYARTREDAPPDCSYRMSGNDIGVKTLNLAGDFADIRAVLDAIADELRTGRKPDQGRGAPA